ncbi:MAG TPA: carotenoid 1,2-hydratase, partial [Casimicrobiaceae bacterium]
AQGSVREFPPPPAARLPATRWRIDRATRTDEGSEASVTRTLEDAPFYARSLVASQLLGKPATAIHESLSLDRFRAGWVRMLLPFRMPRIG